jgi:uncharacterized protein involved in copper resistance
MSNTIKAIMFIQGVTMQCNSGHFNITATAVITNSSHYTIRVSTSGNTTITQLRLARFFYDQTKLQAAKTAFADSAVITASSTNWAQLSLGLRVEVTHQLCSWVNRHRLR